MTDRKHQLADADRTAAAVRRKASIVTAGVWLAGFGATGVQAQNLPQASFGISEIRAGALYHDVPGLWSGFRVERPTVDGNIEVLFNPWGRAFGGWIRPALGTTVNFAHDTSKAYADTRWEIEAPFGGFASLGMGLAVHNGQLGSTDPGRKSLGAPVLFHPSAELGFRFDGKNSVSLFVDHISNGFSRRDNGGMDTIGVRLGHRFVPPGTGAPPDLPVARFAGAYIGVLGGVRANESLWDTGTRSAAHTIGALGGGYVGYNWQSGQAVFGLEADAIAGFPNRASSTVCTPPAVVCQMTPHGIYSVRVRDGWVVNNTMFYGTGGVAIANWDASVVNAATGAQLAAARSTNLGVAAGGGVEHQFSANLIGRAEVIHYGLQRNNLSVAGTSVLDQFHTTTGRLGLAWSFN